ncbi:MAG: hypothetical protein UR29_C0015G0018 [Candidatus Woesebacteria bacterium GW2011_GWC2_33_12]|uniref:Membrane protein insertion efficiency factor n=1 Tax=Candidatus Woesebacteria bacterium GW2011_GWB1_33_22 TaxID=1618566 RepID=A0A0F9ZZC0_9BACT|nr:MAG: hypothetical protein UR29_C0015G0018 [Candidatus Woesebacteria bacterium GW2011_GWC2_33_12]KKP41831.1 MAG: hypothetical protein UR33_C0009G0025 [Candidatus Woesebacteria bacterium GW2011_GWA2_33_20]KKP44311.1 MAG: hypothetical protein UR35_C0009G0022 [Candidatus Woesebacteria bacterium GW2011_GWB1_33_22]KKP46069.1 MAG: hypothetical protein UR37_C0012G0021 [Microgenomates group bacterium GW2011_GWC1_33_28]KKP49959.1 MAG: hypothetical protein UR41_C0011G0021 [Candidatus Woesebacteria bact
MKLLLKIYKNSLSPALKFLFPGGGCRFKPTCSEYMVIMVEKHGLLRGGLMGIKRVLQCNNL